jgi:hypothetical protein
MYKLKCTECEQCYVGQTCRYFKIRYKEYIRDIRNNRDNIGCDVHILNTGHSYGRIEDTMEIIKVTNKGHVTLVFKMLDFFVTQEK